jgi:hypothetical protein
MASLLLLCRALSRHITCTVIGQGKVRTKVLDHFFIVKSAYSTISSKCASNEAAAALF